MTLGEFKSRCGKDCCALVRSRRCGCLPLAAALLLAWAAALLLPVAATAQVSYVTRFVLEKQTFFLGEPIFCKFTIQNTGSQVFAFSYRTPSRILNPELEGEPRFAVSEENGQPLPDPAPKPCGGAKGSAVYGSVTLPPGQIHTERWLVNQWARFSHPGRCRLRAERRLPLLGANVRTQEFSPPPVAYALAINELSFEIVAATQSQLQAAFRSYLKTLEEPEAANAAEAVLVVTTLPQPFLLEPLAALARAPASERRWDRQQALEGLARLGTRAAWEEILRIAQGVQPSQATGPADDPLRAYAVQLLGEKSDPAFLPPLLEMLSTAPETLRGEVLRALGFFNDPRANQVLFQKLHSQVANERVNAVLGLRNLESTDVIPALIAMLSDPEAQVRQVAHFALQGLTGQKFKLSPRASQAESARLAQQWHAWWRAHGASFVPARRAPCQDW
jgi:HEAT repeat protein